MADANFLLVSHNVMSHINPTLHFASKLLSMGAKATLFITTSAARSIDIDQLPNGLCLKTFSDEGVIFTDYHQWLLEYERRGRLALQDLISCSEKEAHPFTCIVHTLLISWVIDVAKTRLPTAILWIQSATVFDVLYYYFNGFGDLIVKNKDNPSFSIQFPGLPLLNYSDLPSFMVSDKDSFMLKQFEGRFDVLEKETDLPILINTFDELEQNVIRGIGKFNLIPIGPLVSFGSNLHQSQKDHIKWLDSKPDSSVVYVAFGSFSSLAKKQIEEIANGLLESEYPFLWVLKLDAIGEELSFLDELMEDQGKIVPWCSQVEVLNHRSIGCFVSHCGWNSTIESVSAGVPVVAYPLWADQSCNAKMVEDVWKNGVRVKSDDEGMVEGKEILSCLKIVMGKGERGEEIRLNAKKWKHLALEAASGSSGLNLNAFVNKICHGN